GSFIIEKLFSIPGLGNEFVESVTNRDYTVIMGTTVFFSILFLVSNLTDDIIYGMIDTLIKITGKQEGDVEMSQTSLNQSDFEPIERKSSEAEKIAGESTSYWKDAWRRFRKNKLAMASIVVIIFLAIMAALGTVLSGQ